MGADEYYGSKLNQWRSCVSEALENKYYPPACEEAVLKKHGKEIASRINNPVTLVCRGAATTFNVKEWSVASHLNVVRVIYIDVCETALNWAVRDGRTAFPHAEHIPLLEDMFKPEMAYMVKEGSTEVNLLFGLTLANVELDIQTSEPDKHYMFKCQRIASQMQSNGHFITTVDTNKNMADVGLSYSQQSGFVMDMLERHNKRLPVSYEVYFIEHEHVLVAAHTWLFVKDCKVETEWGVLSIKKGQKFHFNSSIKPQLETVIDWYQKSGFHCMDAVEDIPFDVSGRIGLLHFRKS